MAAHQGMIRTVPLSAGGPYKVVFPYGGQQFELHSLRTSEAAHTSLLCLMQWAMEDQQRRMEAAAHGLLGTASLEATAAEGSLEQRVQQLQACVAHSNSVDHWEEEPAAYGFMLAAAAEGHTEVVRQLLLLEPGEALIILEGGWTDDYPLHLAALGGHAAAFQLLLQHLQAVRPEEVNWTCEHWYRGETSHWSLMHSAAQGGSAAVIETLLQLASHDPAAEASDGSLPLHVACRCGHLEAARLLLRAAPQTAIALTEWAETPLHMAVGSGDAAVAELLFRAAPEAALMEDNYPWRPLHIALTSNGSQAGWQANPGAACLLLPASGLSASQLLDALSECVFDAQPLYADLASHFALSAAEWERVPTPCRGLGRVLPTVLARSDAEARQLVLHLPAADRERLRVAALSLARLQGRHRVALPAPLVRACLAQCLGD